MFNFCLNLACMLTLSDDRVVLGLNLLKIYIDLRSKAKSHSKMVFTIEADNLGCFLYSYFSQYRDHSNDQNL